MQKKITSLFLAAAVLVFPVFNTSVAIAGVKESKIFIDGKEAPKQSKQTERQRILSAIKEMSCTAKEYFGDFSKFDNKASEKIKVEAETVFKKYGFKIDEKSMKVLGEKYKGDIGFIFELANALTSCGNQQNSTKSLGNSEKSEKELIISAYKDVSCDFKKYLKTLDFNSTSLPDILTNSKESKEFKVFEKKVIKVFKKYGFQADDDEIMSALMMKYFKEKGFIYDLVHALTSCTK